MSFSFSAVLLAGGKSTRMGRDKALLPVAGSELLLWQRQLKILEELRPEEIFWSGAACDGLPKHLRIICDEVENAGPLGGISACLGALRSDLLLVLAIDLPQMNAVFLKNLLARCTPSCGSVARHGDFFEPLAAVYPKGLDSLAREHLRQECRALQELIHEAERAELLQAFSLAEEDAPLFKNLNSPADL